MGLKDLTVLSPFACDALLGRRPLTDIRTLSDAPRPEKDP